MSAFHVAMGCDDDYGLPLSVAARSLARATRGGDVTLWLLALHVRADTRARLERVLQRSGAHVRLQWMPVAAHQLAGLSKSSTLTPAAYLRVLLPDLLPPDVGRVLWLDVDCFVADDVTSLHRVAMSGAPVAAVRDFEFPDTRSRAARFAGTPASPDEIEGYTGHVTSPGLRRAFEAPAPRPYFNSGVMLLDLDVWRREKLGAAVLEFARANDPLPFADQDAINAVLAGREVELDPRWNVQQAMHHVDWVRGDALGFLDVLRAARAQLRRAPGVVHFSGAAKPWDGTNAHPATRQWVGALLRSGYLARGEAAAWLARWLARRAASVARERSAPVRRRFTGPWV